MGWESLPSKMPVELLADDIEWHGGVEDWYEDLMGMRKFLRKSKGSGVTTVAIG